jgi:hypothetical protein
MKFLIVLLVVEFLFKPRLDITKDKKVILWYGKSLKRKYFVIFQL